MALRFHLMNGLNEMFYYLVQRMRERVSVGAHCAAAPVTLAIAQSWLMRTDYYVMRAPLHSISATVQTRAATRFHAQPARLFQNRSRKHGESKVD